MLVICLCVYDAYINLFLFGLVTISHYLKLSLPFKINYKQDNIYYNFQDEQYFNNGINFKVWINNHTIILNDIMIN